MKLVEIRLSIEEETGEVTVVERREEGGLWLQIEPLPVEPCTDCAYWPIHNDQKNNVLVRVEEQLY